MKSLLKAVIFYLIPFSIMAQTFSSGFENNLNIDWDAATSGTGLAKFEISEVSKFKGSNGFHMKFSQTGQKGNLWTPKNIDWKKGTSYTISFYYKAIVKGTNTEPNIKIFSGDGTKIDHINFSLSSESWVKYETSFTSNIDDTNGNMLFSIRPNDDGSGEFYFDDFLIEEVIPETGFFADIKSIDIASDETIKWVQFGPGMSGNNTCFYPHPTDENIVYTSPNMGNSYRSTDKGFTYETILSEDAPANTTGLRGAVEMYSVDFSRQNANYGFMTGKRKGDLFVSEDRGKTWNRQILTQGIIGNAYLACVAVNPHDDNIWFLGAGRMRDYGRLLYPQSAPKGTHIDAKSQGKVWRSTDKGQSWTSVNSGINSNAEFESILVDPVDETIVYAGTNYGFYKSTDGGLTWTLKSNGIDHDMIRSMDIHHNKTTNLVTIYALSNITWKANGTTVENESGGIFKSTDKGETWTNISGDLGVDLTVFVRNENIEKDYYQSISHYFGLSYEAAKSTYPTLPSKLTTRFNMITVDPNDVNNIYLVNNYSNASENNFRPGQIWRTTNGGEKWFVTLRNGKNWNNGSEDAYWVTKRNNPMGTNITMKYKSDWVNRDDYERKGCNFVKFNADGSVLYTQMAKIGFVSYNKGDSWVDIDDEATGTHNSWVGAGNSNVPGHGFYQSELIKNKVFCSSGENSLWITNDEGENVRPSAQGAGVIDITGGEHSVSSVVVHPTDPTIWYATFFRQEKKGQIVKSTDSGKTWNSIGTPVPSPWPVLGGGDQAVHQLSLIIDKNNPNNMYFCVPRSTLKLEWVGDSVTGYGIHKSTDGGVTWTEPNTGLPSSLDVARLAFSPNHDALYAAVINNGGGLFKSVDKGETWTEVESTKNISGTSGINDIHFDKDGKAYITSGFKNEPADSGGLWVSDDNMQTWTKKFDYPWTNRVEVAKYDTKTILVSTLPNSKVNYKNAGTFLSKDAGETWIKINKGNGQSDRVNDIAINYTVPGKYYASTRGSGWYVATDPNPYDKDETLEIQNFKIKSTSETCSDSDNGSISISTNQSLNYTATLTGNSTNESRTFTNSVDFENLASGSYGVCITVEEKADYETCFAIEIKEPDELKVSSKIDVNSSKVSIFLKGANQYFVTLNNQTFTTNKSELILNLKNGSNSLYVKTDKECQGEHKENLNILGAGIFVYPNPVSNILNVHGLSSENELRIFSIEGKLLFSSKGNSTETINVSSLKSGLYLYSIINNLETKTGKFIKL
ncbi:T9SS type A sorting domain-containing protein [uncultured Lutibacter sp.]|uniref:VPS10 domain-containing protein n=1 Tax=uncultured Lutibacter sp. TaxID=437739 RepID=UPI0026267637|nr:T9SS type A sorting domain-containing protein [uncultured Lutibacter sp.]